MTNNIINEDPTKFIANKPTITKTIQKTINTTTYIGVVFKTHEPLDIKKLMNPLIVNQDYYLVCYAKGVNGYFLFIRVTNSPKNKEIIKNVSGVSNTFDIPITKMSTVIDLHNLYSLIRQKKLSDKYIDDALKLQDQLYKNFIQFLHSVVV